MAVGSRPVSAPLLGAGGNTRPIAPCLLEREICIGR